MAASGNALKPNHAFLAKRYALAKMRRYIKKNRCLKISEIDVFLSDPDYVYDDGFGFYEIAKHLKIHEWLSLIELSKSKSQEWNENLLYAQPFRHGQIEEVLPCVFAILKSNKDLSITILRQLDSVALSKTLSEEHVMELAEVWKEEPKLREPVKNHMPRCTKSRDITQVLGSK